MDTQICTECRLDKNIDEYYLLDGLKTFKKCKECVKAKKRAKTVIQPKGFTALPLETQDSIKQDYANRKIKVKAIAAKHNINYSTLCYWIRHNNL